MRALAGLLVLVASACSSVPPKVEVGTVGAAEPVDPAANGITLRTDTITMNGEFEGTCRLHQGTDDRVHLLLTLRSDCETRDPLEVVVKTQKQEVTGEIQLSLKQGKTTPDIDGPTFELPPRDSLVRTVVTATCVGPEKRRVSAYARCLVPARGK